MTEFVADGVLPTIFNHLEIEDQIGSVIFGMSTTKFRELF